MYYKYPENPDNYFFHTNIPVEIWYYPESKVKIGRLHFNNIFDLVNFVKIDCSPNRYIFRGQTRTWVIKPSINRVKESIKDFEINRNFMFAYWLIMEKPNIISNMFYNTEKWFESKYISIFEDILCDAVFSIGQHYGFKTTYVDFTTNIEVAAFFASNGYENIDEVGVVFCYDYYGIDNLKHYKNYQIRNQVFPYKINRIKKQCGLFWESDRYNIYDSGLFEATITHLTFNHHNFNYLTKDINQQVLFPKDDIIENFKNHYLAYEEKKILAKNLSRRFVLDSFKNILVR